MRYPTDEEQVQRADNAWHDFRRVELYRGDPEREAAMKDELVNYIPYLIEVAQRLQAREAQWREIASAVATEDTLAYENDAGDDVRCVFCGGVKNEHGISEYQHVSDYHEWKHADNCPVTQARALLEQK